MHRIVLEPAIYRRAVSADLSDLQENNEEVEQGAAAGDVRHAGRRRGAGADYRTQYAEQWLTLSSAQSGAYRIVLEPAIYRRAVSADLSDLQVFNAASQLLPSALLAPDQPLAQPPVQRELPWFALPPLADAQRNDLLLTERDTDGRVRRVEARVGSAGQRRGRAAG